MSKESSDARFPSAEFCELCCPICTRARRGVWWARIIQRVEMVLTFGGCPAGRARKRKYGVRPDQVLTRKS